MYGYNWILAKTGKKNCRHLRILNFNKNYRSYRFTCLKRIGKMVGKQFRGFPIITHRKVFLRCFRNPTKYQLRIQTISLKKSKN